MTRRCVHRPVRSPGRGASSVGASRVLLVAVLLGALPGRAWGPTRPVLPAAAGGLTAGDLAEFVAVGSEVCATTDTFGGAAYALRCVDLQGSPTWAFPNDAGAHRAFSDLLAVGGEVYFRSRFGDAYFWRRQPDGGLSLVSTWPTSYRLRIPAAAAQGVVFFGREAAGVGRSDQLCCAAVAGSASLSVTELVEAGGSVWGAATGPDAGLDLVRVRVSPAGALEAADVEPGPGSAFVARLTAAGQQVYFAARTPSFDVGTELYSASPTRGPALVRDIRPGPASSSPALLTAVSDTLFFVADDGVHGVELWRTGGTRDSTRLVSDFTPGPGGTVVLAMQAHRGQLALLVAESGDTVLYTCDGRTFSRIGAVPGATWLRSIDRVVYFDLAADAGRTPGAWVPDEASPRVLDLDTGPAWNPLLPPVAVDGGLVYRAVGDAGLALYFVEALRTDAGDLPLFDVDAGADGGAGGDAGTPDAGASDAGADDAGASDGGAADAGLADAGEGDGGRVDAPDAGGGAGTSPGCGCAGVGGAGHVAALALLLAGLATRAGRNRRRGG